MSSLKREVSGPALSPETLRRLNILFSIADQERATDLLCKQCGNNLPFLQDADMYRLERIRFAALKYSDGDLSKLEKALKLAQVDWRDLLVAAGFANDVKAHQRWEPKPAGEPSEIDPERLLSGIHRRLAVVLVPLGFQRQENQWRRNIEVPQGLLVQQGLTSRTEVRFFLRLTLESKPRGVMLQLPRLPAGPAGFSSEQGYIFRTEDSEDALYAQVMNDIARYVEPWFQRFTSASELERGFKDGTFTPHVQAGNRILIF